MIIPYLKFTKYQNGTDLTCMSAGKESEGGRQELEGADEEVEADQRAEHLEQYLKKILKN
jgi:hypothetical protein